MCVGQQNIRSLFGILIDNMETGSVNDIKFFTEIAKMLSVFCYLVFVKCNDILSFHQARIPCHMTRADHNIVSHCIHVGTACLEDGIKRKGKAEVAV